ncbi:flagellar hook protein [Campylobacter pinnipediorum subsp. caledonicus]|uniref:Flagellar hook protein n=1 Tax=Campylobacter pinnipediorum subsp. caledonicus TaxID=1874362 RepID=A0A1S6U784_9BACT|nr:flagellar hook-basal body complex protein [Campylobacter pinnipediorum]AQW85706.1 flagellar hook protein [Campylobacter pinnipediorum subsp. caledonicus]AQW87317.1 flagellar hook protein [Campylobacter pinnipediorum subsp. caledonicus]
MIRGFYNGVAGIKTQSFGIDVWANNISNINNVGFKASLPEFKSIFYQSMVSAGNNPTTDQVGLGATKQTTALDMRMGSFKNTENKFDMAIHGDGFFGVRDRHGDVYYTRAGNFDVDADGNLVDPMGKFVQGTMANLKTATPSKNALKQYDSTKDINKAFSIDEKEVLELENENAQTNIKLPHFLYQQAKATKNVDIKGNLDATRKFENVKVDLKQDSYKHEIKADEKTISISGNINNSPSVNKYKKGDSIIIKIKDGDKLSELSTQVNEDGSWELKDYKLDYMDLKKVEVSAQLLTNQEVANVQKMSTDIFNDDGTKSLLSLRYTKQIPQQNDKTVWDIEATITDEQNNIVETKKGMLTFGPKGTLVETTLTEIGGVNINFAQQEPQNDKNNTNNNANDDKDKQQGIYKGLTTFHSKAVTDIKKDGFIEGLLKSYEVVNNGTIMANFNNGQMFPIAKVALYHFQNDQGLAKMGDNIYTKTSNSGEPFFYKSKNGATILGTNIASNTLEISNVDLGQALTEMIVMQKAYDASSKSITTSDQMIQTAIQMKR